MYTKSTYNREVPNVSVLTQGDTLPNTFWWRVSSWFSCISSLALHDHFKPTANHVKLSLSPESPASFKPWQTTKVSLYLPVIKTIYSGTCDVCSLEKESFLWQMRSKNSCRASTQSGRNWSKDWRSGFANRWYEKRCCHCELPIINNAVWSSSMHYWAGTLHNNRGVVTACIRPFIYFLQLWRSWGRLYQYL